MTKPTHGFTKSGRAVHGRTVDHLPTHNRYARFNKKIAILITEKVGTMTCAWIFSLLALCSLPAVLSGFHVFHTLFPAWLIKASLIALIAWIAQTYIQLVLLSVIMVGQSLSSIAADARSTKTFEDTETLVDAVNLDTDGGLKVINDKLDQLLAEILPKNI